MYICYADESGQTGKVADPKHPFFVIAGVLINTYSMNKTRSDLAQIVAALKKRTAVPFTELKGFDLYNGSGKWKSVEGNLRHVIYEIVLEWFVQRGHKVVLSAVNATEFFKLYAANDSFAKEFESPYAAGVFHLALMIQKTNQLIKKNKGQTLLICDQQDQFEAKASQMISEPPIWSDCYYGYQKGERLAMIIDTAYFVRSHHASFIQVADLIAFVARRHIEICEGDTERFIGESAMIKKWFTLIEPLLVSKACRLPKTKGCSLVSFLQTICPGCLA